MSLRLLPTDECRRGKCSCWWIPVWANTPSAPVNIHENVIKNVSSCKYLSVNPNKPDPTDVPDKLEQSRPLLPQRLRSVFQRCSPACLRTLFKSVLASAVLILLETVSLLIILFLATVQRSLQQPGLFHQTTWFIHPFSEGEFYSVPPSSLRLYDLCFSTEGWKKVYLNIAYHIL